MINRSPIRPATSAQTSSKEGEDLVIDASMPWMWVLKASYLFPGGWISQLFASTARQFSTMAIPTAQAELRSFVAVSKSMATKVP